MSERKTSLRFSKWLLLTIILAQSWFYSGLAQDFDAARMNRDLEIMERILDRIFEESSVFGHVSTQTQGLHIPGYGVILQINHSNSLRIFRHFSGGSGSNVRFRSRPAPRVRSEPVIAPTSDNEKILEPDSVLMEIRRQLTDFFANYVNAIGQLSPGDQVLVLVHFGQPTFAVIPAPEGSSVKSFPRTITASVMKKDVIAFRRDQLTTRQFADAIKFSSQEETGKIDRDITILGEIFDTSLDRKHHHRFALLGRSNGIYVEGLGVIFFMKGAAFGERREERLNIIVEQLIETEPIILEENIEKHVQNSDTVAEQYLGFKGALKQVIADYGHTLRLPNENEMLVLSVDLKMVGSPEQLVISVPFLQLRRFQQGDINMAALEKKFVIREF